MLIEDDVVLNAEVTHIVIQVHVIAENVEPNDGILTKHCEAHSF